LKKAFWPLNINSDLFRANKSKNVIMPKQNALTKSRQWQRVSPYARGKDVGMSKMKKVKKI
jgi:hypothetical protein